MDINQLILALIGAFSTLLAAWFTTRAKQRPGVTPPKRSVRRTIITSGIIFLLGGAATYWVVNSLLPFHRIDERLSTLETYTLIRRGVANFTQAMDSVPLPSLPVGSVILSALSPEKFLRLPGGAAHWVPADGRALDSSSYYVALTGSTRAPHLRALRVGLSPSDSTAAVDSTLQKHTLPTTTVSERNDTGGGTTLYWYMRVR